MGSIISQFVLRQYKQEIDYCVRGPPMSHGPQFGDKHQMQYLAQAGNLKFKSRQ